MKSEKSILTAFVLNLLFSLLEAAGGILTGSIAILSDAVHDLGDAAGIGISYLLEKKSIRRPDSVFTYGYARYSVLGAAFTSLILLAGSAAVIANAFPRLFSPPEIDSDGMIFFALIGITVNLIAALLTREGDSLNQKAVSLHMFEDVLGWASVLAGGFLVRFTSLTVFDPLLSIATSLFIIYHASGNMKQILGILLEKVPDGISTEEIRAHLTEIDGVLDVHHIHIHSLDSTFVSASMHIVTDGDSAGIRHAVRRELNRHGISCITLELESGNEICAEKDCRPDTKIPVRHCHHH